MPYLKLTITDTLGFYNEYLGDYTFDETRSATFTKWYRPPDNWFTAGALRADRFEAILQFLYGATWRSGNEDGSKYIVLDTQAQSFTAAEVADKPWLSANESCYALNAAGALTKIDPQEM